jgi:hypothetical protein
MRQKDVDIEYLKNNLLQYNVGRKFDRLELLPANQKIDKREKRF